MRNKKKDNNLVVLKFSDGKKLYFTSMNRAAVHLGINMGSINWMLMRHTTAVTNDGREVTAVIEDGSEVPYKLINN